jgi:hypothetical protein
MIPPLPQPEGAEILRQLADVPVIFQLVTITVGVIVTGVLLIWWKLRGLSPFRPQQLHAAQLHRLDPATFRDDTTRRTESPLEYLRRTR